VDIRGRDVDFENCACTGKSLARLLQPAILGVLAKTDAHGYEIERRLRELPSFASHPADRGGVYRALGALERDGYIESHWENPSIGPARKVFTITKEGRACLGQWRKTLRSYRSELDELLSFL
jgi:DNA-binding PadR family transcriptional regulator